MVSIKEVRPDPSAITLYAVNALRLFHTLYKIIWIRITILREPSGSWLPLRSWTLTFFTYFGGLLAGLLMEPSIFVWWMSRRWTRVPDSSTCFFCGPIKMAPDGSGSRPKIMNLGKTPTLLAPGAIKKTHLQNMTLYLSTYKPDIINLEGHKCSCLGRTRPDGSNVWIFTSASRFLLWLGEITHMTTCPIRRHDT